MFDTIRGIIGDIAAGAIKDQRILLSQDQLSALDLKLSEALSELGTLRQRVTELTELVGDRDAKIQQLEGAQKQQDQKRDTQAEQRVLVVLMDGTTSEHGLTLEQIMQQTGFSEQVTHLHLARLKGDNLILPRSFLTGSRPQEWHLTKQGREYLDAHGLLR